MQSESSSSSAGIGIRLTDIRRTFEGGVQAVAGISLSVKPGEFVSILGPSGCGKSTLMRMIAGLDQPTGGTIEFGANDERSRREGAAGAGPSPGGGNLRLDYASQRAALHKTAYVFQDAHLLPWRNVLSNVMLPLEFAKLPRAQRKLSAYLALEQVGLADAIDRYPAQLSGGMRMRVSLARALVTEPNLLLLDEPFAALDEITRQKLDEQLRQLWQKRGMTIVFVTHSTTEATFLSDRAVVLTSRPAKIVSDFAIELPKERTGPLRATAEFAAQTRAIYEALDRGSVEPRAVDKRSSGQRDLDDALEKLGSMRRQIPLPENLDNRRDSDDSGNLHRGNE